MRIFDLHVGKNSKFDIGTNLTLRQKWNWHVILDNSENSGITKGKDTLIIAQQVKNLTHCLEPERSIQCSK
jgi:hypothetical protein